MFRRQHMHTSECCHFVLNIERVLFSDTQSTNSSVYEDAEEGIDASKEVPVSEDNTTKGSYWFYKFIPSAVWRKA